MAFFVERGPDGPSVEDSRTIGSSFSGTSFQSVQIGLTFATPGSPCPCRPPPPNSAGRARGGPDACSYRSSTPKRSAHRLPSSGADRPATPCSSHSVGAPSAPCRRARGSVIVDLAKRPVSVRVRSIRYPRPERNHRLLAAFAAADTAGRCQAGVEYRMDQRSIQSRTRARTPVSIGRSDRRKAGCQRNMDGGDGDSCYLSSSHSLR